MARPLTTKQRAALVCRCCDELSVEETAARLGRVSGRSVQRMCDRAYRRLGVHSLGAACWLLGLRGAELLGQRREGAR